LRRETGVYNRAGHVMIVRHIKVSVGGF
jgi:hypothetical protein